MRAEASLDKTARDCRFSSKATVAWYTGRTSQAASQATAFREEVTTAGAVWTLEDDHGVPTPPGDAGRRAMPFWSSRSRGERAIRTNASWSGCRPRQISVAEFRQRWLPGMRRDGLLVGVNWSGERLTGYDVEPSDVEGWLADLPPVDR